ncbi:MAG: hypothetical protein AB7N54_10785 [Alphaproteobacteria bacterium]
MTGIISFAVLVAAIVLGRVAARKMAGGKARGFMARRGVAETLALVLVAAVSFPLAGIIDFLLSGDMKTLDIVGWVLLAAILVVGIVGWIMAGRLPKAGAAKTA